MITSYNIKLGYKIWLELYDELGKNPIIGETKINILKQIQESGSIHKASEDLGIDFKKAHEIINDLQDRFESDRLFNTERGRLGGTNITLLARSLIDTYAVFQSIFDPLVTQINECLASEDEDLIECLNQKNLL